MHGLEQLRTIAAPGANVDPTAGLLNIAKSIVGKRATDTHDEIPLQGLRVDPDYQRPPDREKIAGLVEHLRAGGPVKPIKVNERPDGSRWITDGQHRAAAAVIVGHTHIPAKLTHLPSQQEASQTEILTKVAQERDRDVIGCLLGAGARRHGKRLVLALGTAGEVSYVPHGGEFVGKTERGQLTARGEDARELVDALGLSQFASVSDR